MVAVVGDGRRLAGATEDARLGARPVVVGANGAGPLAAAAGAGVGRGRGGQSGGGCDGHGRIDGDAAAAAARAADGRAVGRAGRVAAVGLGVPVAGSGLAVGVVAAAAGDADTVHGLVGLVVREGSGRRRSRGRGGGSRISLVPPAHTRALLDSSGSSYSSGGGGRLPWRLALDALERAWPVQVGAHGAGPLWRLRLVITDNVLVRRGGSGLLHGGSLA